MNEASFEHSNGTLICSSCRGLIDTEPWRLSWPKKPLGRAGQEALIQNAIEQLGRHREEAELRAAYETGKVVGRREVERKKDD